MRRRTGSALLQPKKSDKSRHERTSGIKDGKQYAQARSSGISAADMAKVRGIASARGCPRKAEFWIENQLGTAREFIAALAANDRRLHELFPGCALANMSGRSILTPEDAARLAKLGRDGEAIWREAEKRDAFGEALAFIRNGRSFREFRQYLANDRVIWHATRQPKRWGDPY
jgi:hypothetical protein